MKAETPKDSLNSSRPAESGDPVVRLTDFGVRYPDFRVGPLNVALRPGERIALVGANGAGKSTTLRSIAGRMPDYTGTIEFRGEDLRNQLPWARASVGFLPERLLGYGWMSVADHLGFLSNFFPGWDADYTTTLMGRLQLPPKSRVGTLSKGMAVKLSLVAAEAARPPVLILDEPTSGIDPVMRGEILEVIGECAPEGSDRLVLYSSHILEDVEKLADRVLLMADGRIITDESAAALRGVHPDQSLSRILYRHLRRAQTPSHDSTTDDLTRPIPAEGDSE